MTPGNNLKRVRLKISTQCAVVSISGRVFLDNLTEDQKKLQPFPLF